MSSYFDTPINYLKGVGPIKGKIIEEELQIFTFGDFLQNYPFRYEDRTQFHRISQIHRPLPNNIQLRGIITHIKLFTTGKKRLVASFQDDTGAISLVWFQGITWLLKNIKINTPYVVFGKPSIYNQQSIQIIHPECTLISPYLPLNIGFIPIYHTTDKLKKNYLDTKGMALLQRVLLKQSLEYIKETLPPYLIKKLQLVSKKEAIQGIHMPGNESILQKSKFRLKFEEFFYIQINLLKSREIRIEKQQGKIFDNTLLFNDFYKNHLSFTLTNAQKKVIKDIYKDFKSGKQMNRLLQGDVGSGKTIVALLSMLIVIGSGSQVAMMVPTEILATQHYARFKELALKMNIPVGLLTGSTKKKERIFLFDQLQLGIIKILIGTHALLGENVQFKELGFLVIDEQHRFGVAQRATLWGRNKSYFPHVLIMTATPIPRTLSMSLYGDLDVAVIDEMPVGRKEIKTIHYYDNKRLRVFQFLRNQIALGKQVYIVYPLVEESVILDYKNLMDGYESICRDFPGINVGIVHGKMNSSDKAYEMERFFKKETSILVATTVIEVGINIPNATVMLIENAERFGLSQLHQLRGRVGRGGDQSYCILMTDYKLNEKSKKRIQTMVQTNNGFEVAAIDLQLRGPGDLMGVQQSGLLDLKIGDLSQDGNILQLARKYAQKIIKEDPKLIKPVHFCILEQCKKNDTMNNWNRIG